MQGGSINILKLHAKIDHEQNEFRVPCHNLVQKLLCSNLLSPNINVVIQRSVILSVVVELGVSQQATNKG